MNYLDSEELYYQNMKFYFRLYSRSLVKTLDRTAYVPKNSTPIIDLYLIYDEPMQKQNQSKSFKLKIQYKILHCFPSYSEMANDPKNYSTFVNIPKSKIDEFPSFIHKLPSISVTDFLEDHDFFIDDTIFIKFTLKKC